ncbi:efflux RND transporter periplasmic adaptor subunit [Cernens ardua]|uniref:efflux RND transporter periplasmic adaptor subunit n=1 Tax=Cernens ardua TaxID=3402176 RepID=UPI003F964B51
MKKLSTFLTFRVVITLFVVICALFVLHALWRYYMDLPWTRDAHVAEDIVTLAPDVSGIVERVDVKDNASVQKGQVLFTIDQSHYRIAVAQAKGQLDEANAGVVQQQAQVEELAREVARDRALGNLVSTEDAQSRRAKLASAKADLQAAQATVQTAEANLAKANLDLRRTVVRAPSNGRLNDGIIRAGSYAHAGQNALAILETSTLHIEAYLEETRFSHLHVDSPVKIQLMGQSQTLHGHIESIAAGIVNRYSSQGSDLIPNVTPQFEWVRLAQRIPVRIAIDSVPKGVELVAGRTATIYVQSDAQAHASRDGASHD